MRRRSRRREPGDVDFHWRRSRASSAGRRRRKPRRCCRERRSGCGQGHETRRCRSGSAVARLRYRSSLTRFRADERFLERRSRARRRAPGSELSFETANAVHDIVIPRSFAELAVVDNIDADFNLLPHHCADAARQRRVMRCLIVGFAAALCRKTAANSTPAAAGCRCGW